MSVCFQCCVCSNIDVLRRFIDFTLSRCQSSSETLYLEFSKKLEWKVNQLENAPATQVSGQTLKMHHNVSKQTQVFDAIKGSKFSLYIRFGNRHVYIFSFISFIYFNSMLKPDCVCFLIIFSLIIL